ncbi:VOC family protein [Umezawaea sp.]|uniref:VOC family protein n=1 Tax=Umezawaea sp. TaxID=1955258 RepID=UPI002ED4D545
MSYVTGVQPNGTPTWIDLGIPDLERAKEFYGSLFGWEFASAGPEAGYYTTALLDGRRVAALAPNEGETEFWWNVYFAADDCDSAAKRVVESGGRVTVEPVDVMTQGRMAIAIDPTGARFGLWQGRDHIGCEVVNEPNSLVRNDLATPSPEPAREFYSSVFGFALDRNEDMPDFDFTFLRRPDGHEVAGIFGNPEATRSRWATTFEVADTDEAVARAVAGGGGAGEASDMLYGRIATLTDPFGTEFSVITRA